MELIRKYLEEEKKMSVILERTIAKLERHADIVKSSSFIKPKNIKLTRHSKLKDIQQKIFLRCHSWMGLCI